MVGIQAFCGPIPNARNLSRVQARFNCAKDALRNAILKLKYVLC
jgi:hypothetical protein